MLTTPEVRKEMRPGPLPQRLVAKWAPLGLGMLCFAALVAYFAVAGFSVLVSDVGSYNHWSHGLVANWVNWHLPFYPTIIAVARWATGNLLPDGLLMQCLTLGSWTGGVLVAKKLFERLCPESASFALLVYALAPFVGVTYAAFPLADTLAQLLMLGTLWCALEGRAWGVVMLTACALLTHMVLWPGLALLAAVGLLRRRLAWWQVLLSGVPLGLYYGNLAVRRHDPLWFFRVHYQVNFNTGTRLRVFDAVLGTFQQGGLHGLIKGGILVVTCLAAVALSVYFARRKDGLMLSLTVPLVLFAATLNRQEAWALVRFSRFLILPAALWLEARPALRRGLQRPACYWATAVVLLGTQFAWGAYEIRFYQLQSTSPV